MSKLMGIAVTVGVLLAGSAVKAQAQCGSLAVVDCAYGDDGENHHTDSGGTLGGTDHGDCRYCKSYGVVTHGEVCHSCSGLIGGDEGDLFASLLQAGQKGNLVAVLKLGKRLPDNVLYNEERSSIQIASCDKTTILATLSLNSDLQRRLAQGLRRAGGVPHPAAVGAQ